MIDENVKFIRECIIKHSGNFRYFLFHFSKILTDKTTTKKDKEVHRPFSASLDQSQKQNASVQIPSNPYSSINLPPQASKAQQPKIDATDRRQIEAQNEDKCHSTKEELDDIKRTHYEEKQKKEQAIIEPCQSGMNNQIL